MALGHGVGSRQQSILQLQKQKKGLLGKLKTPGEPRNEKTTCGQEQVETRTNFKNLKKGNKRERATRGSEVGKPNRAAAQ